MPALVLVLTSLTSSSLLVSFGVDRFVAALLVCGRRQFRISRNRTLPEWFFNASILELRLDAGRSAWLTSFPFSRAVTGFPTASIWYSFQNKSPTGHGPGAAMVCPFE
jgi:hypothetical protein